MMLMHYTYGCVALLHIGDNDGDAMLRAVELHADGACSVMVQAIIV